MATFRKTKLALAASGSLVLTACGGGGGAGAVINNLGSSLSDLADLSSYADTLTSVTTELQGAAGLASVSAIIAPTAQDQRDAADAATKIDNALTTWNNFESWLERQPTSMKARIYGNPKYVNAKAIMNVVKDEIKPLINKIANGESIDTNMYADYGNQLNNKISAEETKLRPIVEKQKADAEKAEVERIAQQEAEKAEAAETITPDPVAEQPAETAKEVTENVIPDESASDVEDESVPDNANALTLLDSIVKETTDSVLSTSNPAVTTESIEETRVSTDANGSTVTEVYTIYTTTSTIAVTTTTTVTKKQIKTWSDGSTTEEVVSTDVSTSTKDNVSVTQTEALKSRTVTPNVASTTDTDSSVDTVTRGDATVTTTSENETRTGLDENGSTVTEEWIIYTDTTTVPVTTTTTVTTTRTTSWTDGTTTSEVVNVTSTDATIDETSTSTRETLVSSTTTPNVVSTSTEDVVTTSVSRGDATVTTTSEQNTRTSLDANGSTVTEVYTVYTDTTTVPVTTTTVTTTNRTTLYTDGTSVTEPINVASVDAVENEVSTATREELVSSTVTPNVSSTEDTDSTSTTTTVSDPVLQETIVNTDTRADGVWTFYYDVWVTTTTTTTTVVTTRTTTYTDGTSTSEVVNTDTTETVTTSEQVKVRYTRPEDTEVADPEAPESSAGTVVTQNDAPTLDYDPDTYNASTYYNSASVGTPTDVASHNPADFSTQEFDNGANSEIHANYAYARGWTGKGSTVMVMDTGYDTDHTDLVDQVKYEWEPGYDTGIEDVHGHGTHVAGIVAGAKNDTGTHGVAYDAQLAIAKIGETSASTFYARRALNWAKQYDDIVAANLSANSYSTYSNVVDRGNGIFTNDTDIDASISTDSWAAAMPEELVLTMSAGNASYDYSAAPTPIATATDVDGNLKLGGRVLIVGNWNKTTNTIDGGKAGHVCRDFSNGTCNDAYVTSDFYILAPGIAVNSTYKDGAYKEMSGTSMASPVVAGAVAIVHQLWPYMKGENIAQLLLQTADKDLPNYSKVTHGAGLLDLDQATRPVGDLGISLTGRTGTTMPLSGTLGANIDDSVLSSIAAVDEFDRDFTVDLSPAQYNTSITLNHAQAAETNGWSASLANLNVQKVGDFQFGSSEDTGNITLGYTTAVSKKLDLTLSYTKSDTSPWADISGMWGETEGSQTVDARIQYKFGKQITAQVGLMSTKTDIKPGIVTRANDVQAAYAGISYNEYMANKDKLSVYAGVKPYAVNGSLDLRVPTGVDADGNMQYKTLNTRIKSQVETYAGLNYTDQLDEMTSTRYSAGVDSTGNATAGIQFTHRFW